MGYSLSGTVGLAFSGRIRRVYVHEGDCQFHHSSLQSQTKSQFLQQSAVNGDLYRAVSDSSHHSFSYTLQAALVEMTGQSPHHSPKATQSPLVFTPQIPVIPLQKPDEMLITNHSWMQVSSGYEDMCSKQGFPTMFTWGYGGKEVAAGGSWDNWKIRKSRQRLGKEFAIMKMLPSFRLARSCP